MQSSVYRYIKGVNECERQIISAKIIFDEFIKELSMIFESKKWVSNIMDNAIDHMA
jgi:hypothetical protein